MAEGRPGRMILPGKSDPADLTPVRLLRPHGFIDEVGRRHHWHAGDIIVDPAEIELLTKRGAVMEKV